MNDLDNNITKLETDDEPETGGFDPTRVFADPITYLERFGVRSELIETSGSGFRTAA